MPSACNVLGFSWVYWCGRLQENDPKALLHNTGEIFTSCWPNHRKPKWSPLQSCPPVTHLEQAYAKAYTPRKNITVDDGLEIKWKAFLQAVHANEAWKIWHQSLASCWCWHICSTVPSVLEPESDKQWAISRKRPLLLCCLDSWRAPHK